MQLDRMTPEQHRQRYTQLRDTARSRTLAAREVADHFTADRVIRQEVVPSGWYWSARILRGQALRLVNTHATSGIAAMLWNAHDTTERFNAGDTVKLQWTARLGRGRVLFSDMGRVLVSIVGDTCGRHDALVGGGGGGRGRNTRDNLRLAAGKQGLDRRDIAPCMTFFAPVAVADDGTLAWEPGVLRPGQHVDLRAEMDLLVALSNCPHPLSPDAEAAGSVEAILWQAPPPGVDDECRNLSDEAVRGFQNTDGAI